MLDPQIKQMIELYESLNFPDLTQETSVEEVRAFFAQFSSNPLKQLKKSTSKIQDFKASTCAGDLRIRGYYPEKKGSTSPLLFFRGSGFVVNNFDDSDDFCIRLARETQRLILSIDYPLAPEHPFPESLEACFDVYKWAIEHATFASLDPKEIILMGESSGGCLVALLCSLIRDRGLSAPQKQILLYPILSPYYLKPSYQKYGKGYILTLKKLDWYLSHYTKNLKNEQKELAFPLFQKRFDQLPQTIIYNAQCDLLSDDGLEYAQKLIDAGVPCESQTFQGMIHGFIKFEGLKKPDEIFKKLCQSITSQSLSAY